MSVRRAVLGFMAKRREAAGTACAACRHFRNDPGALEAALPGFAGLSSGHGSVRGDDGLCVEHDRFAAARSSCPTFAARGAAAPRGAAAAGPAFKPSRSRRPAAAPGA